jgi:predicted RNase H-like nuclease (RuvC/YqgF family)
MNIEKMNHEVDFYYKSLYDTIEGLKIAVDEQIGKQLEKASSNIRELENNIVLLKTENDGLKTMNEYLNSDKSKLESYISNLEEEHRNFTKVSKIIALENENAKLRKELEDIKQKEHKEIRKDTLINKSIETKGIQDTNDDEESVEVYEKKISGVYYYVDDSKRVYCKMTDGGIGDHIGYLESVSGKTKLVKI